MTTDAMRKAIELANTGRRVKAMDLVRPDMEQAALISKLVSGQETPQYDNKGNRKPRAPQTEAFRNISQHTAQNISDAETVMQLLPDMDLARQILVSSILSPKDMMTRELTLNGPEDLMAPDVLSAMMSRTRQHFEQDYKIKPLLSDFLDDALFYTGSYAIAVIPENAIDEVINSTARMSMESFADFVKPDGSMRSMGILGPAVMDKPAQARSAPGISLETFDDQITPPDVDGKVTFEGIMDKPVDDSYLFVTDNINVLKIPAINKKIRENRVTNTYGLNKGAMALESQRQDMERRGKKISDRDLDNLLYKHRSFTHQPIVSIKTQDQLNRRSVGAPMILHLPSESVIPVFIPGTPEEQIGFFVLLDADGNPISRLSNVDYFQELQSRLNSNGSFPSAMLTKVKSMMDGFERNNHLTDYSIRYCQEIVEADLLARFRNGGHGNVAIARKDEVTRIMLSRMLSKQYTQMLFVPVELMTYIAFKHNPDGIGESILDDMKVLNSMRSMLMFANIMAAVKNSIGRTKVDFSLDPDDPDPKKTIEIGTHEIVRSRQQYFPLGMNSPTDLTDWLQRAGFEFTFKNHPGIPEVDIEFTQVASQYQKPDTELMELLDKRAIMKTGLTPDNIDAAFHSEFATSIVQNNILLSKRIIGLQEKFEPQLMDHMRKEILANETLLEDYRQILLDNYDSLNPDNHDLHQSKEQAKSAVREQQDEKNQEHFALAAKKAIARKNETGTDGAGAAGMQEEGVQSGEETEGQQAGGAQEPEQRGTPYGTTQFGKTAEETGKGQPEEVDAELEDHKKRFVVENILQQFVRGLECSLPRPNSVTMENQAQALDTFTKLLEPCLDAYISDKFFTTDLAGNVANQVNAYRESVKAHLTRKFMAENGIMPELAELTAADEAGKPLLNVFDMTRAHIEALAKSLTEEIVKLTVVKNASDQILEQTGAGGSGGGSSSYDTPSDDTSLGGGDNDFGGGGGDIPGLDDTPPDTGTTETPEASPESTPADNKGAEEPEKKDNE